MTRPRSPFLVSALLVVVLLAVGACASDHRLPNAPGSASTVAGRRAALAAAIEVQEQVSEGLLATTGVAGTAVGLDPFGRPVIRVYLLAPGVTRIPDVIDGVPVVAEVSGAFRPFALTGRYRPVPIGVSAGNANECLPGTFGAVLLRDGRRYVLSANHVLARQNQAAIGEAIVQPSRPDASPTCDPSPMRNVVGQLSEFEPLRFDGTDNVMDAAIALLTADSDCGTLPEFYGTPGAPVAPGAGTAIQKVGRTTGLTHGTITGINGKVNIFYAGGKARFTGQIMTSKAFGDFGDSGSLVVTDDAERHAVGMVFAGGNNGSAVVNPIGAILTRFGATLCGP